MGSIIARAKLRNNLGQVGQCHQLIEHGTGRGTVTFFGWEGDLSIMTAYRRG